MIGQRLAGRYEITKELGRGGMGIVYVAHDPVLDREVAVKVVPGDRLTPEAEARLQREARVVARLDHAGIITVYDFARHEDSVFFVMPVVRGASLRALLGEGPMPAAQALDLAAQVAAALDYSHQAGVIHRDVKPENVMVLREGAGLRVRVMDFGIALARTDTRMTQAGTIVGTLAYLSPEQLRGDPLDERSDIYSLGVVLYECLAGRAPFEGGWEAVLYAAVHEPPPSLRSLGVEVGEDLEALLASCLSKQPSERPQTAGALAAALRALGQGSGPIALPVPLSPGVAGTPLIGREQEVAELLQRMERTRGGECHFVLVGGEPGMGRTRLLAEVEAQAVARGTRVFHGRFVERTDPAFPFQGFYEVIQEALRRRGGDRPDLTDVMTELSALFPMLAEGEGPTTTPAPGAEQPTAQRSRDTGTGVVRARPSRVENKTAVFELLARTLSRIVGGRRLVLLLEDLDAADISVEALQYAFRRLAAVPLLVVASYDSSEVGDTHPLARTIKGFRGDPRFAALQLQPLDAEQHQRLVDAVAAGRAVDASVVAQIHELSEGNPLFVVETLRALLDSGPRAQGGISDGVAPLPVSAAQVVERRLERLEADERQVLAGASVLGRSFEVRDLEALLDESRLESILERLVERSLLEEEPRSRGDRLRFASGLTREVLYAGLPTRRRRTLHRRHAESLEQRHAESPNRIAHQLSRHYALGGVGDKAVRYSLAAAATALLASAAEDAARFARTALEVMAEDDLADGTARARGQLLLARAHGQAGRIEEALAAASQAASSARAAGDTRLLLESLLEAAEMAWKDRRIEEAKRWAEEGALLASDAPDVQTRFMLLVEQIADRHSVPAAPAAPHSPAPTGQTGRISGFGDSANLDRLAQAEYLGLQESYAASARREGSDPAALAASLQRLSTLARQLGRYAEAHDWLLEAVERKVSGPPSLLAELEGSLAGVLLRMGRVSEAAQRVRSATGRLEGEGAESRGRLVLLQATVDLALAQGDESTAAAAALALLSAPGDGSMRVASLLAVAEARASVGDHASAGALLEQALQDRGASDHASLVRAGIIRTEMLLSAGDADGALEQVDPAFALAVDHRDPWLLSAVRLLAGRARLAVGELEEAEEDFLRVMRDATRLGAPAQVLEAQLGLVSVNRLRGRLLAAEIGARISVELSREQGSAATTAAARLALAEVLADAGQSDEAREQLTTAEKGIASSADHHRRWPILLRALELEAAGDDLTTARALAATLARECNEWRAWGFRSRAHRSLASALHAAASPAAALDEARAALRDAYAAGSPRLVVDAYHLLAAVAADGPRHAQAALEAAEAVGAGGFRVRAAARLKLAALQRDAGEEAAMTASLEDALSELRAGGQASALAEGYVEAASIVGPRDPKRAEAMLEDAQKLAAAAENPACEARALAMLGDLALRGGRISDAVELLRAEASCRELSGSNAELRANRVRLAWAYHAFGDWREAGTLLEEAAAARPADAWTVRAIVLRARIHAERAEFADAADDLELALSLADGAGGRRERVLVRRERAEHCLAYGDVIAAGREVSLGLEACDTLSVAADSWIGYAARAALDLTAARVAIGSHRSQDAIRLASSAGEGYRRSDDVLGELQARLVAAEAGLMQGRDETQAVEAVLEQAAGLGVPLLRSDALLLLARTRRSPARADEAFRIASDMGAPVRLAVSARVMADAHARAGHAADAVRASTVAARALGKLRDALPPAARGTALLFWESRARALGGVTGGTGPAQ